LNTWWNEKIDLIFPWKCFATNQPYIVADRREGTTQHDTGVRVGLAVLAASCQKLEEPLPYEVRSSVSLDMVRIFVKEVEGT
jgi:hypothetical protein